MYVPSNSPKYICKKCRNKIPVVDLEGVYFEELRGFFHSADDLEDFLAEADNSIADNVRMLEVLKKEQLQVQADLDNLFALHGRGEIPTEGFGKRYDPLQERLDQLEDEIPRIEADIDYLKANLLSADQVLHEAQDLHKRWPKLGRDERRHIVENITDKIVIGGDNITINLAYLPVSGELMAQSQRNFTVALPSIILGVTDVFF